MTVDDWVLEAVTVLGRGGTGASSRQVQRYIDDKHHEELAVDTLQASLAKWVGAGKVEEREDRWYLVKTTSKEDAARRLFND